MKQLTKDLIIKEIKKIAAEQNFEWLNTYEKAKSDLLFKCKSTGFITKTSWSTLKQQNVIPKRNTASYHELRLKNICSKYNLTNLSPYVNYLTKIKYKCNACNNEYERPLHKIYKCNKCNNFYKYNKGINQTTVIRNPYLNYKLYFVYLPKYKAYKIGLYKGKYVRSRFNVSDIEIIKVLDLPLYKAFYLEQYIINKFATYKYKGPKFGGYTEAFNNNIVKEDVIKIMATSILDVKPCELLESLEVGNQQPSFIEI